MRKGRNTLGKANVWLAAGLSVALSACQPSKSGAHLADDRSNINDCFNQTTAGTLFGSALSGLIGLLPVPGAGLIGSVGYALVTKITACDYKAIESGQIITNVNLSTRTLYDELDQLKVDLEQQNLVTLDSLNKMKTLNLNANIKIMEALKPGDPNMFGLLNEARGLFYDLVAVYSGVSAQVASSQSLGYVAGVNQIYLAHAVIFLSDASRIATVLAKLPADFYPDAVAELRNSLLHFTANVVFLVDNIARHRNDPAGKVQFGLGSDALIDFDDAGYTDSPLFTSDGSSALIDTMKFAKSSRSMRVYIAAFGGLLASKTFGGSDLVDVSLPIDLSQCANCRDLTPDDLVTRLGQEPLKKLVANSLDFLYRHPENQVHGVTLQHPPAFAPLLSSFQKASQLYESINPEQLGKLKAFAVEFFSKDLGGVYQGDGNITFAPTLNPLHAP